MNQLIALLENWETYEKMMSEFASDNAVGSAMREAEKSANNWSGSINKLKNSWAEMTNEFVNSDNAVKILDSLNEIIQSLTDSSVTQTLGVIAKLITNIIGAFGNISKFAGTLPTLISTIALIKGLKGGGIFGSGAAEGATGIGRITSAFKNLNLEVIAVTASVTLLTNAFTKWWNKEKTARAKAERERKEQEELRRQTLEKIKAYEEEANELNYLTNEYVKLVTSTKDINSVKTELVNLQDQIVSKYQLEKDSIDLVNKSLEENISLLTQQKVKENEAWLRENSTDIKRANDFFTQNKKQSPYTLSFDVLRDRYGATQKENDRYEKALTESSVAYSKVKQYLETYYQSILQNIDFVEEDSAGAGGKDKIRSFVIKTGLNAEEQTKTMNALTEAYQSWMSLQNNLNNTYTSFDFDGLLEDINNQNKAFSEFYEIRSKEQSIKQQSVGLKAFEDDVKTADEYNRLIIQLNELNAKYNDEAATVADRFSASLQLKETVKSLREIGLKYPEVSANIESAISQIGLSSMQASNSFETAKEAWLKSLDEAQKGIVNDVDKIVSAMQKIASGEALNAKTAWEIINMDDQGLLSNIQIDANGDYILSLEEIANLKDDIIQKEVEERKQSVATAQTQANILGNRIELQKKELELEKAKYNIILANGINSAADERYYRELIAKIEALETAIEGDNAAMEAYNYTIKNESLYIAELTSKTGDLINTQAMQEAILKRLNAELDALNKEADGLLKAQTSTIDNIISKREAELSVLEKQKEALEEQKENLEEILDHYKTVQDVVTSTIDKQIEAIEKEREAIEEYYDKQIKQLQAQNDERETAIEREQKLANLANAKNNKVRVYSEERGFEYAVDQDALKKAQNELDSFENNEKIKALEAEKEKATEGFDERIKSYEEYAKLWKKSTDEITEAEEEQLAQEILGSDWRDKIKNKDTEVVQQFQKAYQNYESSLSRLTKIEMSDLDKSIKAKQKEINSWKDYKTSIQDAANALKNANEDYKQYLDTVQIDESSTQETRINNLNTFVDKYKKVVSQIVNTQKDIDATTAKINNLSSAAAGMTGSTSVASGISSGASSLSDLASGISATASKIGKLLDLFEKKGGAFDYLKAIAQFAITGKLSDETAKNTGLSWKSVLHGARDMSIPDVAYTTPTAMSSPQGYLANAVNKNLVATTNFNISNIEINGVQNPVEFAQAFEAQINRYWQTKLTENKVYQ